MSKVYTPSGEVKISKDDLIGALDFWKHFNIPPVKVPGLHELVAQLMAKGDALTVDDCERAKYLVCYEIAYSTHEAFADPMFSLIVKECKEMVALMDAYYPGRVWI